MELALLRATIEDFRIHGIDKHKGLKKILAFQDLIGRAHMEEITNAFAGLDLTERKNFYWICFNTLAMDMALELLRQCTAIPTIKQGLKPLQDELDEIYANNAYLEREIANLKHENQILQDKLNAIREIL